MLNCFIFHSPFFPYEMNYTINEKKNMDSLFSLKIFLNENCINVNVQCPIRNLLVSLEDMERNYFRLSVFVLISVNNQPYLDTNPGLY